VEYSTYSQVVASGLIRAGSLAGFTSIAVMEVTRTFNLSLAAASALSFIRQLCFAPMVNLDDISMHIQLRCSAFWASFPLVQTLNHRLVANNLYHHRRSRYERLDDMQAICDEP